MKRIYSFIRVAFLKVKRSHLFLLLFGFVSLMWFLIRVIPKPSRAAYPCQRAAFPVASAFVLWIAGSIFSNAIFKKAKSAFRLGKHYQALVYSLFAIGLFLITIFGFQIKESVYSAVNFNQISNEGKILYARTIAGVTQSVINPEATVAIIQSDKAKAADITSDDIDRMIRQAVDMAGGFDTLIHEGDLVVIKPNVIAARAQNDSYSNAFPKEANGIATDYRIIQVVVNMVREKNQSGKIIMIEGSGYGLTRKNINAIGYDKITGLDSIICLDENITKWYNTSSSTLVKVSLPTGKNLYSSTNVYYLNKVYSEADVLISLPCLKSHFLTGITGSIKNVGIGATPVEMYGNGTTVASDDLPGRWNHINHGDFSTQTVSLDKWIHDFFLCKPVNYVIMDGLQGADYGPYPGSNSNHSLASVQKNLRVIMAGKDPLAVDATEALIAGFDPYLIGHLVYLGKDSVGCINPAYIKIKGVQVHEIKTDFKEDNPGRKCKTTDFTSPDASFTKFYIENNEIVVGIEPLNDVAKVEVAYEDKILEPIAISNFEDIHFPVTIENPDINKVTVLVYDRFLNCTKMTKATTGKGKMGMNGKLYLYPNPAKSKLTINCPFTNGKDVNYSIFTLSGGKIAEATLTTDIDISKLSRGKYFIEVSQGNERYRQSFVKE
jgi:uncharacterized protein (DUF362 family)